MNILNLFKQSFLAKTIIILAVMLTGGANFAWAQKPLPYSYGFENNNLAGEGWTIVDGCTRTSYTTGLLSSGALPHSGGYCFRFHANDNPPQYLISPELSVSSNGINVSFYYRGYGNSASAEVSFQVGYSKGGKSVSDFLWDDAVSFYSSSHTLYETSFPSGSKYIAIRYLTNEINNYRYLCIDDISITENTPYTIPTDFSLTSFTATSATFTWKKGNNEEKFQMQYIKQGDADSTTIEIGDVLTKTLNDLSTGIEYKAKLRSDYDGGNYSAWTEEISFTPIDAWEDFSKGIPSSWYNQDSHWTTNRTGYEGMASATLNSKELRSPRIYMKKDETVSFDVTVTGSGSLAVKYYKTNRSGSLKTVDTYSTSGRKTFTAPSDGYYWLQFKGSSCAVDNFSGIEPATGENLMEVSIASMVSTGTVGGDYTASATLRELGGNNETYTAQLYYDDKLVAEKTGQSINANRDETVSLTFTPLEELSKQMYIKIIYNGGETNIQTGWRTVSMSNPTKILDENDSESINRTTAVYSQVVWMKYSATNGWNTICVPFLLTDTYLQQIFGSDYKTYKIKSYNNGNLSFENTTSYSVSTPYLVYAPNANDVDSNKIFLKSLSIYVSDWSSANKTQTKGNASFIGTFDPKAAPDMEGKYGVTTAGKLGKGNSSASIKGYRAYVEVSDPSLSRLSIIIDDDEENQTTDLGFVKLIDKEANDVFNLQGQKVKKATKGIYIVNGRKVIIK